MIPKIIHYCWFGGNPLPESAQKCIASWQKFLPDYEIKEWNESNYDVHKIPYIHEAYEAKKYAFVSDYARFDILYQNGGIYFDTDVEVIAPMNHIIEKGNFMGREAGAYITDKELTAEPKGEAVNPGLGLGVAPGLGLYKELLDGYAKRHFRREDGTLDTSTIVGYTTDFLLAHGMTNDNDHPQLVADVWIYPADVFCPMDHTKANKLNITPNTVSIHHYDCTWLDKNTTEWRMHQLKATLSKVFGKELTAKVADIIKGR